MKSQFWLTTVASLALISFPLAYPHSAQAVTVTIVGTNGANGVSVPGFPSLANGGPGGDATLPDRIPILATLPTQLAELAEKALMLQIYFRQVRMERAALLRRSPTPVHPMPLAMVPRPPLAAAERLAAMAPFYRRVTVVRVATPTRSLPSVAFRTVRQAQPALGE